MFFPFTFEVEYHSFKLQGRRVSLPKKKCLEVWKDKRVGDKG